MPARPFQPALWTFALLSALISMVFLCALSLATASATRQPLLGLAVAGGYWALDLLKGS